VEDCLKGRAFYRDRLAPALRLLHGGVAVIRVGAPAESEMKAKKEALDDAISATKAAVSEGIVPGGGLALLRCVDALTSLACRQQPLVDWPVWREHERQF
jgi:chaperonin GroEL (HSP60 family)